MRRLAGRREVLRGAPRTRLELMVLTVALALAALIGAVHPELRTTPPVVLLPVVVSAVVLLPRPVPVAHDSWLLERIAPRTALVACCAESAIGVAGALLAVAVQSPRPLVLTAGAVLVLGFVVVAVVPAQGGAQRSVRSGQCAPVSARRGGCS